MAGRRRYGWIWKLALTLLALLLLAAFVYVQLIKFAMHD